MPQVYPHRITLFDEKKNWKVFEFKNMAEEEEQLSTGAWKENPNDWDVPDDPPGDYDCDLCGFPGKSANSLRMHKMSKHGIK